MEILDQPDVTLETVIAGRSMGLDPKHWNVHMQIGGILLHQTDPPRTAQARRFYSNSRRLAGDSLPLWEEWLIEEGIGLSWLMEDNGVEAIPHLERSVQIGREHPDLIKGGEASLYNLACAQSLAGSQEQACAALEEFMGRKERKERKKALAEIRKDSQLKGARDSPCYGAVVALAKKKKGADQ